jgi:hypothetical protein
MMRLGRRGSLLVALSLLTAATAYAECGWVMWVGSISPVESWSISGAHPTLRECMTDLRNLAKTLQNNGYKVAGGLLPASRTALYQKDSNKGYLHCLPDTVDPRAPKAK